MKNYKSIICVVAAVYLLGPAAFCGFRIYHYYAEVDEQTVTFEEIAEMVEQAPTDETVPDDTPVSEGEDVLASIKTIEKNGGEFSRSFIFENEEAYVYLLRL